jgi:hypothetical protein
MGAGNKPGKNCKNQDGYKKQINLINFHNSPIS